MPAKKKATKKRVKKNPTDPNLLARAVVEAAIGEPLKPKKPSKVMRKSKLVPKAKPRRAKAGGGAGGKR